VDINPKYSTTGYPWFGLHLIIPFDAGKVALATAI
jgi:hypothetical protein